MTTEIPIGAYLQSEAEFLATVIAYARANGWAVRHVLETRHHAKVIGPGFPDLELVRPPRIVIAELKRQDAPRKLPREQAEWIALFLGCVADNPGLSVHVWRPSDWPEIEEILAA